MPSRFDDNCYGTTRAKEDLMPKDLLKPTSAGDQFRAGGWTRLGKPAGGEVPDTGFYYPLSGNAGMDTDGDADDIYPPIGALILRETQP